jgi:RHS repeat-associated protein
MGCLQLTYEPILKVIARMEKCERSGEGESCAGVYKYKYNGKEYQDELGLNMYDYGARNYDPALGRWMNIDPLAEGYENLSPYNYAMNNPMYFVDPDGMRIKIGDGYYSYVENRDYDDEKYKDNRSAYEALDKLYSSGAANITFGEGDSAETINIIDKLIELKSDVDILTVSSEDHYFKAGANEVLFAENFGIVTATEAGVSQESLNEASKTGKLGKGMAYNSATAQLGHELLHAYNYNYDYGYTGNQKIPFTKGVGYGGRKMEKTRTQDTNQRSYGNGEEKYTTTLSNQINRALQEPERWDHRGGSEGVRMESPTSNKPLKATAND